MKKVLVISQHGWLPKINAQIIRLASLIKHLPENGWEPIIFARKTQPWEFTDNDFSINIKKVYYYTGYLPYIPRINTILRLFFISDIFELDLILNINNIKNIIEKEKPDVILASTPPSGLIAAAIVSKRTGVPLVLDYADPWTISKGYSPPTKLHSSFDYNIEKKLIKHSKGITVASLKHMEIMKNRFGNTNKFVWLPNGFYKNEFNFNINKKNKKKIFTYAGTIYGKSDLSFLKLFEDIDSNIKEKFELLFVGKIPEGRFHEIKESNYDFIKIIGKVSKKDFSEIIKSSDVLIFSLGNRYDDVMPSRIPEYIASGKPIMAFTSENSISGQILKKSNTAFLFNKNCNEKAKEFIIKAIKGEIKVEPNMDYILNFEWTNLSKKLADVLEEAHE